MNQILESLCLGSFVFNADKELGLIFGAAYIRDVKEGAVGELLDESGVGLQVVKDITFATDDKIKFCFHC